MATSVIRTSNRWIDGDCFGVRETTTDGKKTVKLSPEPGSTCGPKPLMTSSGKPGARPKWLMPVLIGGAAIGLFVWWRKR